MGEIPCEMSAGSALEGGNPREHPAIVVLTPRRIARDSQRGQSPGTAVRRSGSAPAVGLSAGRNGRWVHPGGNARDTL
jgi:hypothetical protein